MRQDVQEFVAFGGQSQVAGVREDRGLNSHFKVLPQRPPALRPVRNEDWQSASLRGPVLLAGLDDVGNGSRGRFPFGQRRSGGRTVVDVVNGLNTSLADTKLSPLTSRNNTGEQPDRGPVPGPGRLLPVDPVDDVQNVQAVTEPLPSTSAGNSAFCQANERGHRNRELGPGRQRGRAGIGGRHANAELANVTDERSPRKRNVRGSNESHQGKAVPSSFVGRVGQRLARILIDERVGSQRKTEGAIRPGRLIRDRPIDAGRIIYVGNPDREPCLCG